MIVFHENCQAKTIVLYSVLNGIRVPIFIVQTINIGTRRHKQLAFTTVKTLRVKTKGKYSD